MKLIDSNRFYLPGTHERFLHLASVHHGVREFMCFMDVRTQKVYIEEVTGGHLEFVEDDSLVSDIHCFLIETGVLDVGKPTLPDTDWLRKGKTH